jgi:hypothetical protein
MSPINIALMHENIKTARNSYIYIAYLITRYINSFRCIISVILMALDRMKKDTNGCYKYNPISNPTIPIEQLFISINLVMIYLNLLTFFLAYQPICDVERIENVRYLLTNYICRLCTLSNL